MSHSAGGSAVAWFRAWGRAARFALVAGAAALSRTAYTPRARTVALQQVYFTAWQVLPGLMLFVVLLGVVISEITVTVARQYGLAAYALELVFRVLVLEMLPLLTAFFVALRSGAAISTDPFEREFVPRIIAAAISVVALTVLGCIVVLILAYLAMYGFSPWGFAEYTRTIAWVFGPSVLAGFALKCFAFGVAVAVIPIAAGVDATRQIKSAPVAVLGGMVRLFFALGLIEIVALAVKYV